MITKVNNGTDSPSDHFKSDQANSSTWNSNSLINALSSTPPHHTINSTQSDGLVMSPNGLNVADSASMPYQACSPVQLPSPKVTISSTDEDWRHSVESS